MKILLTTDGASFFGEAVSAVARTIVPEGAEVLVLEVVEPLALTPPPQMAPGYAPEEAERRKELFKVATQVTDEAAATLRQAGFKANTRVVGSEIRSGILDVAAEWKPDLIVLGSHGRRRVEKFLLGSVAESVARHARCSVLIVRSTPKGTLAPQAA
jgi:nucleotide-binding universal stress UspA family protein